MVSSVILWTKPHLTKGADWSQDIYTIPHNDVLMTLITSTR